METAEDCLIKYANPTLWAEFIQHQCRRHYILLGRTSRTRGREYMGQPNPKYSHNPEENLIFIRSFKKCLEILDKVKKAESPYQIRLLTYIFSNNFELIKNKLNDQDKRLIQNISGEVKPLFDKAIQRVEIEQQNSIAHVNTPSFIHKYTRREVFPEKEIYQYQKQLLKNRGISAILIVNHKVILQREFRDAKAIAGAFQLEVVAYNFMSKRGYLNGFIKGSGDIIYINVLACKPGITNIPTADEQIKYITHTSIHEVTHHFMTRNRVLYDELIGLAMDFRYISFKEYQDKKNIGRIKGIIYSPEEYLHENIADFIADHVTRQCFWDYVTHKDKGLFKILFFRLRDISDRLIQFISTYVRNDKQKRHEYKEIRQLELQILKIHRATKGKKGFADNNVQLIDGEDKGDIMISMVET